MTLAARTVAIADEAAMARLAEDVALLLRPGMTLALKGDLGAGKTTFTRALLRAIADDPSLDVPSPTFSLMQPYELPRLAVAHVDFYRLEGRAEADVLGLDDWSARGAVLAEWPERVGLAPGPGIAEVAIAFGAGPTARSVTLTADPAFIAAFDRGAAIRAFLAASGWPGGARRFLQGDASTRRFERVTAAGGRRAVLMDAPRQPDGRPVRNGRAYSTLARLAEDVRPFVAIGTALRARGLSAPELYAAVLEQGLLLVEDLGDDKIVDARGAVIPERYAAAVDLLAHFHSEPMPRRVPLPGGAAYELPEFDGDVMEIELSVFLDWYLPAFASPAGEAERQRFTALWRPLFARLGAAERHWLLRDFHSPNLMWLADRPGIRAVGLIDYQDALIGPTAYDLVSVLQDARTPVPADLEAELFARYVAARRATAPEFDEARFREAYVISSAQRAVRILGVFTRLRDRDGKPGYIRQIPQLKDYLARTLAHPVLAELARWLGERGMFAPAAPEPDAADAGGGPLCGERRA